ncbi:short coiled-coil protein B-like [Dysidea avara]|uniref:short coiled-coil protein B-like n=1 Tax=Dysidea avara TaxID=196820 RepID=UPI0033212B16
MAEGSDAISGEKLELIQRIIELQNTLHDLSQRVNSVREENSKLKSENEVLNKYIENLMTASDVFAATTNIIPKT